MGLHNRKQAFADELIHKLGDKKKRAFGFYMGLMKKYGESQMRILLSEIMDEYRTGKMRADERVKLFVHRLTKKDNKQRSEIKN